MLPLSYPKIVVATDNVTSALSFKRKLACHGVFASFLSFDDARRSLDNFDILILFSSKYSSAAMALITLLRKTNTDLPTIIFAPDDVSDRYNLVARNCYTTAVFDNCILNAIDEHSNIDVFTSQTQHIVTHLYDEGFIVYRGVRLYLTDTEAALVHYLALSQEYAASAELADALGVSVSSIPVFVNSINNKAKQFTASPMIRSKRSQGYFIQ